MKALVAVPAAVLLAGGLAWAGGRGGFETGGVSVFGICVAVAFVIQWLAFIPAYRARTEAYYDLTGSFTYITVCGLALGLTGKIEVGSLLLLAMVAIWAARLGGHLYARIRREGSDRRFEEIKVSGPRFFVAWTLQGLWVSFTAGAALAAMASTRSLALGPVVWLGVAIWITGMAIEGIADVQKLRFRSRPENRDRFIQTGLWSWSRHPNYFGEIVLWLGVALVASPALEGWQRVTLVSPVFVFLLLTRGSGIPLLEEAADRRWGGQPDYEDYKAHTPVLVPSRPKARR